RDLDTWATSDWVIEGEISQINRYTGSSSSTGYKDLVVANVERSEQPIEPKFFQIILCDLDKLRLDLDLFRNGDVRLFNQCIDQIQIILRVTNDQTAALRKKVGASAFRERHALSFEKFLSPFAVYQLLPAGRFLRVFTSACGS